jgi:hypothetical protein
LEPNGTLAFDPDVVRLLAMVKFGATGGVTEVLKEKFCLMYTLSQVGAVLGAQPPL